MSESVRAALATIVEGGTLSLEEARLAMGAVMDGEATPAQLAALLMGLRMRGETVDELAGFASAMRERVVPVEAPEGAIDVVGTGGDNSGTFNISTASALVVAAAGVPVAKHGNRAMTSKAGSADVLDALGVRIDHDAASASAALAEYGFAFLFAPNFHPAMKYAGPTRREIGVRTAFNLLGPLTNPASANAQVIGVAAASLTEPLARVLAELGTLRAFVVHGADGLDEISNTGESRLSEVREGVVRSFTVQPEDFGLPRATMSDLKGGDRQQNAQIIREVLAREAGPRRDIVLMNASAALVAGGRAKELKDGVELAAQSIDSGAARERLERLVAYSQKLAADKN
jgi:anthranilate phosphoribosyltransferase